MTGRFQNIIRKVERAEKHIEHFKLALDAFFHSEPYLIRFKDKPDVRERVYYLDRIEDTPADLSLIAGDALQNLRSSLDHLACALVEVAGGSVTQFTMFPIAKSPNVFQSPGFKTRKVQGMRQQAITRIDAIKPYKGGDDALWRLHALNNVDKHRLLLTVCTAHFARSIMPSESAKLLQVFRGSYGPNAILPNLNASLVPLPLPIALKAGDKLFAVPESELEENMSFHFDVAFNEPQITPLESALGTLQQFAKLVRDIVTGFDPML